MPWQVLLFVLIRLAVLCTGAAAVMWTLHRSLARRRAAQRNPEPRCGRCGYIVHPGSRSVCSECGSGFDEVGIVTPATSAPAFPWLPLWLCCVLATLLAWWAGPRLAAATPWGWDFHAGHQVQTSQTRWVPSMHEGSFSVNARGIGRGWGLHVRELNVTYKIPDANWITLDVEPGGATCRIRTRPRPIGPLPVNRQSVARFIEAAGFDPASPEADRLSDQLLGTVKQFLARDLPTESIGTSGDWPGRTSFDSIQFWPNDYAGWVAGAIVWVATLMTCILVLRAWQRRRRRALLREGRVLVAQLGLT